MNERDAIMAFIDRFAQSWFTMWFYPDALYAKDVYQPKWVKIPYGSLASMAPLLLMVARPYRYSMRRKVRKTYGL